MRLVSFLDCLFVFRALFSSAPLSRVGYVLILLLVHEVLVLVKERPIVVFEVIILMNGLVLVVDILSLIGNERISLSKLLILIVNISQVLLLIMQFLTFIYDLFD